VIRAIRWFVLAALVIVAGGCFKNLFGPPRPPLEQYQLVVPRTEDGVVPLPARPVLTGMLSVRPYVTRGLYDDRGIVFRVDDLQLSAYTSRYEWAIPLREQLGTLTEELLRSRPLTSEPATFDLRGRERDYEWRGTVREFEEVDRGRQVLAAVRLDVEIIRTANDSVVWSGSERIERAVPEPTNDMKRVIETLSALTGDVLTRLIDRARSDLGAPAAGTARVPG
jgi:ABC-type uncharacterized transport system auxiliary subunit